jgi:hypothetical protein
MMVEGRHEFKVNLVDENTIEIDIWTVFLFTRSDDDVIEEVRPMFDRIERGVVGYGTEFGLHFGGSKR